MSLLCGTRNLALPSSRDYNLGQRRLQSASAGPSYPALRHLLLRASQMGCAQQAESLQRWASPYTEDSDKDLGLLPSDEQLSQAL